MLGIPLGIGVEGGAMAGLNRCREREQAGQPEGGEGGQTVHKRSSRVACEIEDLILFHSCLVFSLWQIILQSRFPSHSVARMLRTHPSEEGARRVGTPAPFPGGNSSA